MKPSGGHSVQPAVKVQKLTLADNHEVFVNTFKRTAMATGWPEVQWVAVLIPYLIRPAQQAMDTLPVGDLANYKKVRIAMLQTLNLSSEAYHRHLWEIEFGPDYHSWLMGQKIKASCMR